MDFKDQIKQLSERVAKLKENIGTEEATKTAFIMPLFRHWDMMFLTPRKWFRSLPAI